MGTATRHSKRPASLSKVRYMTTSTEKRRPQRASMTLKSWNHPFTTTSST